MSETNPNTPDAGTGFGLLADLAKVKGDTDLLLAHLDTRYQRERAEILRDHERRVRAVLDRRPVRAAS